MGFILGDDLCFLVIFFWTSLNLSSLRRGGNFEGYYEIKHVGEVSWSPGTVVTQSSLAKLDEDPADMTGAMSEYYPVLPKFEKPRSL